MGGKILLNSRKLLLTASGDPQDPPHRMEEGEYTNEEDLEDARWLRTYVGKTGFVQLGWAYQGCIFLYETGTEWYEHYQRLHEISQDFGGLAIDESDQEDEP